MAFLLPFTSKPRKSIINDSNLLYKEKKYQKEIAYGNANKSNEVEVAITNRPRN